MIESLNLTSLKNLFLSILPMQSSDPIFPMEFNMSGWKVVLTQLSFSSLIKVKFIWS